MIRLVVIFVIVSFAQIFGESDDRQDILELSGQDRAAANSVVTLVRREGLINLTEDSFRIMSSELRNDPGFCADENFAEQRASYAVQCSGVLIAPDVVMTAGHCVQSRADCRDYVFIFGYDSQSVNQTFSRGSTYECQDLLYQELDEVRDTAFVKLDRPVNGIAPLNWRRSGELSVGENIYTIGTPFGLPLMRADGEVLYVGEEASGLSTNIDSFSGNSGGPVLNSRNHTIEGILVGGEPFPQAYIDSSLGCLRWTRATIVETDTYRPYGFRNEIVTRTRVVPVSDILPLLERYGSYGGRAEETASGVVE